MDTTSGEIRELGPDEPLKPNEEEIKEALAKMLMEYEEKERLIIYKGLKSPNKSAKRRAVKKLAKKAMR